jgi:hypothetical protein
MGKQDQVHDLASDPGKLIHQHEALFKSPLLTAQPRAKKTSTHANDRHTPSSSSTDETSDRSSACDVNALDFDEKVAVGLDGRRHISPKCLVDQSWRHAIQCGPKVVSLPWLAASNCMWK